MSTDSLRSAFLLIFSKQIYNENETTFSYMIIFIRKKVNKLLSAPSSLSFKRLSQVFRSFEALSIKLSAASGKGNSNCNHESQTILETIIKNHGQGTNIGKC